MKSGWIAVGILSAALAQTPHPCAECHESLVAKQQASHHVQSLRPFSGSLLADKLLAGEITDRGFRFRYAQDRVMVTRGNEQAEMPLGWTFGAGTQAQTALGRAGGRYVEHRISWYAAPQRLALTPGHLPQAPTSAEAALGLVQSPQDAYRCFNCHSTGTERDEEGGPDLRAMVPGLQCERCHGPGEKHMELARSERPVAQIRSAIFNSSRLPARAGVEFCGGCHRMPTPGMRSPIPEIDDPLSVRFQPVGLMASRCFRESGRLTCPTCHDPHNNLVRDDPAHYTKQCVNCHAASKAKVVKCQRTQNANCLPCHMARTSPKPFLTFTDHRIRVD